MTKQLTEIPAKAIADALKAGKYCYSMGVLATVIDTLMASNQNMDGSYKNPLNEAGREKIRDTCFERLAAPLVIKEKNGTNEVVEAVRTKAKEERSR